MLENVYSYRTRFSLSHQWAGVISTPWKTTSKDFRALAIDTAVTALQRVVWRSSSRHWQLAKRVLRLKVFKPKTLTCRLGYVRMYWCVTSRSPYSTLFQKLSTCCRIVPACKEAFPAIDHQVCWCIRLSITYSACHGLALDIQLLN